MSQFKIDPATNDLVFDAPNGGLGEVSGADEIVQRVKFALSTIKGEFVFNTEMGVPYVGEIIGAKGVSPALLVAIFRDAILAVQGITEITEGPEVDFDTATRQVSVSFRALGDVGELVFDEEI